MTARLLLVDDEPMNLGLLEANLAPDGYDMTVAESGSGALEAFEASPPDLVLLDVGMPDIDGIDVLMHVRAVDQVRGTRRSS